MKKYFPYLMIVIAILFLGGCDVTTTSQTSPKEAAYSDSSVLPTETMMTANQLAIPVSSIQSLMIPYLYSSNPELLGYTLLDEGTTEDPLLTDEVDELDKYLELVSQFLAEDNGLTVSVSESNREDYSFMATYNLSTLYDGIKTYVLYYNESEPVVEVEPTDEPVIDEPTNEEPTDLSFKHPHEFTFPCRENITENVVAVLDGLLVDGEKETTLEGALIQTESEEIVRLYAFKDKSNFVKLNVKTDLLDHSKSFLFLMVEDGLKISESKMKVSLEENETHVKLELLQEGTYTRFDATSSTLDGVTSIHIRYQIVSGNDVYESGNVIVTQSTDENTGEIIYDYVVLTDGFKKGNEFHYGHQEGFVKGPHHDEPYQDGLNGKGPHGGGKGIHSDQDSNCNQDNPGDTTIDIPGDTEI